MELNVIDHYNGSERSVKTLSGGETFQASLSLALGLSDEIQSMAGGIQMDAMFVDEGFGSLDEDALNQAVKALGNLAEGKKTGWHHFSCFRAERQDRQENCNNKKSQRRESWKQHNGIRGLFSRWGVRIYVKTLGANGKWLPTKIYIYGIMTGACVNSFFCDFPDFSSRTILVSSDAVRFFLKSSYAEEERIFFCVSSFCNNRDITVPF